MTDRTRRALILLVVAALLAAALVGMVEWGRQSTAAHRAPMQRCVELGWCHPSNLDRYPGHDR